MILSIGECPSNSPFLIDLQQVGGFLRFPTPIKLTTTILTEILLKVVLSSMPLTIESDERNINLFVPRNYPVYSLISLIYGRID
jgi:hypothetical protein